MADAIANANADVAVEAEAEHPATVPPSAKNDPLHKANRIRWLKLNFTIKTAKIQTLKRQKYQHLQEEALLRARGLLQNWENGVVVLTEDLYRRAAGERDAEELMNYTPEALALRFSLRNSPAVLEAVRQLWAIDMPRDVMGCIDQRGYASVFRRIAKSLDPKAFRKRKLDRLLSEDWKRDSKGEPQMSFATFFDSIFELADLWCETIDAEDYVYFLDRLRDRIAHVRGGKRVFKPMKKVAAFDADTDDSEEEEEEEQEDEDEGEEDADGGDEPQRGRRVGITPAAAPTSPSFLTTKAIGRSSLPVATPKPLATPSRSTATASSARKLATVASTALAATASQSSLLSSSRRAAAARSRPPSGTTVRSLPAPFADPNTSSAGVTTFTPPTSAGDASSVVLPPRSRTPQQRRGSVVTTIEFGDDGVIRPVPLAPGPDPATVQVSTNVSTPPPSYSSVLSAAAMAATAFAASGNVRREKSRPSLAVAAAAALAAGDGLGSSPSRPGSGMAASHSVPTLPSSADGALGSNYQSLIPSTTPEPQRKRVFTVSTAKRAILLTATQPRRVEHAHVAPTVLHSPLQFGFDAVVDKGGQSLQHHPVIDTPTSVNLVDSAEAPSGQSYSLSPVLSRRQEKSESGTNEAEGREEENNQHPTWGEYKQPMIINAPSEPDPSDVGDVAIQAIRGPSADESHPMPLQMRLPHESQEQLSIMAPGGLSTNTSGTTPSKSTVLTPVRSPTRSPAQMRRHGNQGMSAAVAGATAITHGGSVLGTGTERTQSPGNFAAYVNGRQTAPAIDFSDSVVMTSYVIQRSAASLPKPLINDRPRAPGSKESSRPFMTSSPSQPELRGTRALPAVTVEPPSPSPPQSMPKKINKSIGTVIVIGGPSNQNALPPEHDTSTRPQRHPEGLSTPDAVKSAIPTIDSVYGVGVTPHGHEQRPHARLNSAPKSPERHDSEPLGTPWDTFNDYDDVHDQESSTGALLLTENALETLAILKTKRAAALSAGKSRSRPSDPVSTSPPRTAASPSPAHSSGVARQQLQRRRHGGGSDRQSTTKAPHDPTDDELDDDEDDGNRDDAFPATRRGPILTVSALGGSSVDSGQGLFLQQLRHPLSRRSSFEEGDDGAASYRPRTGSTRPASTLTPAITDLQLGDLPAEPTRTRKRSRPRTTNQVPVQGAPGDRGAFTLELCGETTAGGHRAQLKTSQAPRSPSHSPHKECTCSRRRCPRGGEGEDAVDMANGHVPPKSPVQYVLDRRFEHHEGDGPEEPPQEKEECAHCAGGGRPLTDVTMIVNATHEVVLQPVSKEAIVQEAQTKNLPSRSEMMRRRCKYTHGRV